MEISLLAIQIGIVFLPGLLWARLDSTYGRPSRSNDLEFFLRTFLFGLVSYAVTFFVFAAAGKTFSVIGLGAKQSTSLITPAIAYEVVCAVAVSFVLSVLWLFATNYKLLTRFLHFVGATKVYGDEDVWDFVFNSKGKFTEYVQVRDFANRIVYAGWVDTFSEAGKLRELFLREARIYDFDANLMFEMPSIYLARSPENIHIEFPALRSLSEVPDGV